MENPGHVFAASGRNRCCTVGSNRQETLPCTAHNVASSWHKERGFVRAAGHVLQRALPLPLSQSRKQVELQYPLTMMRRDRGCRMQDCCVHRRCHSADRSCCRYFSNSVILWGSSRQRRTMPWPCIFYWVRLSTGCTSQFRNRRLGRRLSARRCWDYT